MNKLLPLQATRAAIQLGATIVLSLIYNWIATPTACKDWMRKLPTVIARLDRAIYAASITRALKWITRSSRVMTTVADISAWVNSIRTFWIAAPMARNDGGCVAVIVVAALLLTSCGFRPIYGENHKALPIKISSIITVNQDYGKLEYIMRQELESAFNPTRAQEPDRYVMKVRLLKTILSFDTQSNRISTRQRVDLRADFTLLDMNGKKIAEDFVIASDSFDITVSPYSSLISEEESSNLLARTLAQEIGLRVAATIGGD